MEGCIYIACFHNNASELFLADNSRNIHRAKTLEITHAGFLAFVNHITSRYAALWAHEYSKAGKTIFKPFPITLQPNYPAYLDTLLALKLQHLSPALLDIRPFRPEDGSQRLFSQMHTVHVSN